MAGSDGSVKVPLSELLSTYLERTTARPAYQQAWKTNFPPAALAALTA